MANMQAEEILSRLSPDQKKAVEYIAGPSLVIAGAGSGKTRVLTYKIAYLLEQGLKPWNVLALTFTNKAANEMRNRIASLVGQERARYLQMGTFHSIFSRILRVESEAIGFTPNYTIYDETDSRSLVKSIVRGLGLDDKKYKPALVTQRISMAKNRLILPEQYLTNRDFMAYDRECGIPDTGMIYSAYQARMKTTNVMDFDDLLVQTHLLFTRHPDILHKYEQQFEFVLVDEYQDTNHVQQEIILQLTKNRCRVCVVGDDAQSIYAFRGANVDNILNFRSHFHDARLFKLERNYRSTQRIVKAANSLIRHNERQIPKDIYSENSEGNKIELKKAYSDSEEALMVCKDIERYRKREGLNYGDIAILYRTNSQSRSFEEQLRRKNIPYRIYGGMSFYHRKEIKDTIAYFRLVVNPHDDEAFVRVVNYPARGVGQTTLRKLVECARLNNASLWTVVGSLHLFDAGLTKSAREKLNAFHRFISSFIGQADKTDVSALGTAIVRESGILTEIMNDTDAENISRKENLEELLTSMEEFVDTRREEGLEEHVYLADFLQEVSLMSDVDEKNRTDEERVTLMTIHSAKGLEFPVVFIVGMEENIFPSPMSVDSNRKLEEERRLLYVAITRAERHCILTCARHRNRYGKMEFNPPSRFLSDIDPALILSDDAVPENPRPSSLFDGRPEHLRSWNRPASVMSGSGRFPKPSGERSFAPVGRRLKPVPSDTAPSAVSSQQPSAGLSAGMTIEHERFGIGHIVQVEGQGENTKATVTFQHAGTKQLLVKFARFKIIP